MKNFGKCYHKLSDLNNISNKIVTLFIEDFNTKKEKVIIDTLFKAYKEYNLEVYIFSRKEFENFIKTMLPRYLKERS